MAVARVQMPDGRVARLEVPDGTTPDEVQAFVTSQMAAPPKPAEKAETFDPTEGMSGLNKFLAGTGKAFVDVGRGVGQLTGLMSQEQIDEARRLDGPLMRTGAGTAGNVVGNVAAMIPAAMLPGASTLPGAALVGTMSGAAQPVASGDSRAANAAVGGVFGLGGQAVANTIGRAARPVRATLPPQAASLAGKAQGMGIDLSAAQLTGSKPLRWIDSALDNLPFTAERQSAMKGAQRQAWQRGVMGQIGEAADDGGTAAMGAAKERIGQVFRDVAARNTVTLDDTLLQQVSRVKAENAKAGPLASGKVDEVADWLAQKSKPTANQVADWLEQMASQTPPRVAPGGVLDGTTYQEIRSILSRKSADAFKSGDSQLGQSLKALRQSLDDAAERSIAPADAAAWATARQQYGTMKAIEKAVDPNTGMISPKKLINELTRKNPNAMIYGQGDQTLPDMARIGKEFIAETLPDSGTAQRSWYMNMLQNPAAGFGGLLGFAGGGAPGALLGAAAGAGTPLAAQRALWSTAGKNYLSQGFQPVTNALPYINVGAQALPLGLLNSQQ